MEDMLIQADFSAVPDVIKSVPAGIYDLFIDTVEKKAPKAKPDGLISLGYNIVVGMHVHSGPHEGRKMTDYIWISTDPTLSKEERDRNLTGIKRFLKATGVEITPQGANPVLAIGKIAKVMVKGDVWQGKETSKIDRYFIPGDPELSTTPTLS